MSRPVAIFDSKASTGIDQLIPLNQRWASNVAASITPNLYTTTSNPPGQVPQILWLGCSDSRVPETSLLGLNPGEVFTQRNIANLFNPQDVSFPTASCQTLTSVNLQPAVLAYAVEHVKVVHIILCGHTSCGGVTTAAATAPCGIASVDNWLVPLKGLMARHSKLISAAPNAVQALVTLSVQHGVKLLKANNTVAESPVVVHGAVYDITTGLLSFLGEAGQAPLQEPDPDWMTVPNEFIHVGNFNTSQVRSAPQTNTTMNYTFAQPYSKPPHIFLGMSAFDVVIHNDNPRMICSATNITTTGFTVNINTWGSSIINSAACTWLEIPDTVDYSDFQTGSFNTSDDHSWSNVIALTKRSITFAKPYSQPPTIVVWVAGFDTAQNPSMSLSAFATDITATGFVMNLDTISSVAVYGQWTNWLAFPTNSTFGLQALDFGVHQAAGQSTTAVSTFDQRDLNARLAPQVAGALNQVFVASPTSYKARVILGSATGSTVPWTAETWGDASLTVCKGTYITVPGLKSASSIL